MSFTVWMNSKLRKLNWVDIQCIKLGSAAFVLMVAKLWPPLLSLDWYWYLVIALLAVVKPVYKEFVE